MKFQSGELGVKPVRAQVIGDMEINAIGGDASVNALGAKLALALFWIFREIELFLTKVLNTQGN